MLQITRRINLEIDINKLKSNPIGTKTCFYRRDIRTSGIVASFKNNGATINIYLII